MCKPFYTNDSVKVPFCKPFVLFQIEYGVRFAQCAQSIQKSPAMNRKTVITDGEDQVGKQGKAIKTCCMDHIIQTLAFVIRSQ